MFYRKRVSRAQRDGSKKRLYHTNDHSSLIVAEVEVGKELVGFLQGH